MWPSATGLAASLALSVRSTRLAVAEEYSAVVADAYHTL